MKNTLRRAMALVVSMSLCLSLLPTAVLATGTEADATAAISVGLTPEVEVTGYEQVDLSWDVVDGATSYRLYRGVDGVFTLLADGLTVTSYQDITMEPDVIYSYRVDYVAGDGGEIAGTEVEMSQLADIAALQRNAVLYYDLSQYVFDGTTSLDMSGDIDKIQGMTAGSIIMRVTYQGQTSGKEPIFYVDGTSGDLFYGTADGEARYELNGFNSYMGARGVLSGSQWTTMAIAQGGSSIDVSVNGASTLGNYSNCDGFMSRAGTITGITIGGGNGNFWAGDIDYITITNQVLTTQQLAEISTYEPPTAESKNTVDALLDQSPDNTWVFAGSDEIKSSTASSGGARTFVGHFEEYLRWVHADGQVTYQRYMFSTSPAAGISLAELNEDFYNQIGKYQPKAVAIMIDDQDFDTNLAALEASLQAIVDQIYDLGAVPVLLTPYLSNDSATNQNIEAIIDMMSTVAANNVDNGVEITLVDFYSTGSTALLNGDDTLNADGHYALGEILTLAITGQIMSYDGFGTEVVAESTQQDSGEAVEGILADLENPTILFLGDSITHGASHTYGYASVPQLFEKALADIGMGESVILNTAVSSANAGTGLNGTLSEDYYEYRVGRYLDDGDIDVDIVVIMLGTNDCVLSGMTTETYRTNLTYLVNQVKDAGAIPVLRTPNPINESQGSRYTNLPSYVDIIRQVAEAESVLLVDHYAEWTELMEEMPYLANDASNKIWLNDGLHPNANGQLNMFKALFEAIAGTDNLNDTTLSQLSYTYELVETEGRGVDSYVTATTDSFVLDVAALQGATSQTLEGVTMWVTADGQELAVSTADMTEMLTLEGLDSQTVYTLYVSCFYGSGNNHGYVLNYEGVSLHTDADLAVGTNLEVVVTATEPCSVGDVLADLVYTLEGVVQEDALFTLINPTDCPDNILFAVEGNTLTVANSVAKGERYQIYLQAEAGGVTTSIITYVTIPLEEGTLLYQTNLQLEDVSQAYALSDQELAGIVEADSLTIVVEFRQENSEYGALFSLSDSSVANYYFALIVKDGALVMEHRSQAASDLTNKVNGAWPILLTEDEINTVAFRATENVGYDIFVNGELVQTIALDESSYLAPGDINGVNTGYLGKTHRSTDVNGYSMLGDIYEIQVYDYAVDDETLLARTAGTAKTGLTAYRDDFINVFEAYLSANNTEGSKAANAGSNYFRIPSLLTTSAGTVIASADLRYGGTGDSANNLDIGIRTMEYTDEDYKDRYWNDVIAAAYYDDFSDAYHIMNTSSYVYTNQSASFIDPVLVEDTEYHEGRIYLVTDAFASGGGASSTSVYQASATSYLGTGFVEGSTTKWLLKKAGDTAYNYYVDAVNLDQDGMRTIYRVEDDSALEEYKLTADFEVVYNGVIQQVAQRSTDYVNSTNTLDQSLFSGQYVNMNIMYDSAEFTVYPTMYMYLFYSDDQGATWSHPTNITGMVKNEDWGFFGVGPGVGIQIQEGQYAGRILVPAYTYIGAGSNNQTTCSIYSDDGGMTWSRGEVVTMANGVNSMSESQYVELPDGSIRVYSRTNGYYVGYATSLDGGATWSEAQYDYSLPHIGGSGCQISVINYSQTIGGQPAIVFSGPTGSSRTNGIIRIGLIYDTGATGADRYEVLWAYEEEIITYDPDATAEDPTYGRPNNFAYSCLTELPNGDIGVIYETTNSKNPLEDSIRYTEYTMEELMDRSIAVYLGYDSVVETTEGDSVVFDVTVTYSDSVRMLENPVVWLTDGENSYTACYVGTEDNMTYRFYAIVPQGQYTVSYSNPSSVSQRGVAVTMLLDDYAVVEDNQGNDPDGESDDNNNNNNNNNNSSSNRPSTTTPQVETEEELDELEEGAAVDPANFQDIQGHWAEDAITFVVEQGLFNGTGETSFTPDGTMTRGMFVTVLGRLAGIDVSGYGETVFSDVSGDAYYAAYIAWAYASGITSGVSATAFDPDSDITREQMAVLLANFTQFTGKELIANNEAMDFADGENINSWAVDAVEAMQTAGIINGREDGSFDPSATATRGEAATMLMRYVG